MNGGRVRPVQRGPMTGLIAVLVLLGGLDASVGLDVAGWLAGIVSGAIASAALGRGLTHHRLACLGPADLVTSTRATLACGVAALTADSFDRPAPVPTLVAMTIVALVLDWVDGRVARRTQTASPLGARFDLEVDAFLILVLSVYVARSAGAWVLAIGAARYAFAVAGWVWPWLRITLPFRYWRKVVTAVQGIVLTVAAAGVTNPSITYAALVVALALLTESFGRDVLWSWRCRSSVSSRPSGATGGVRLRVP